MKRVGLKQEFHGEPDPAQEGIAAAGTSDGDQVTLDVKSGTVAYRVPSETRDNEVIQDRFLSGFIELNLQLEDGNILVVQVSEGAQGVDARIAPPEVPQTG